MSKLPLLIAALVAAGPALAAPGDPNPPRLAETAGIDASKAWAGAHVDQEDWLLVDMAKAQFWFVSSLPTDAPNYPLVRDWIRSEIGGGGGGSRSFLMLVEVDCARPRYRTVEYYHYQHNNLRGSFYTGEEPPDKWLESPKPGTIAHSFIQTICRSAR